MPRSVSFSGAGDNHGVIFLGDSSGNQWLTQLSSLSYLRFAFPQNSTVDVPSYDAILKVISSTIVRGQGLAELGIPKKAKHRIVVSPEKRSFGPLNYSIIAGSSSFRNRVGCRVVRTQHTPHSMTSLVEPLAASPPQINSVRPDKGPTSTIDFLCILAYIAFHKLSVYFVIYLLLPRVHLNSLLANLNARQGLREHTYIPTVPFIFKPSNSRDSIGRSSNNRQVDQHVIEIAVEKVTEVRDFDQESQRTKEIIENWKTQGVELDATE
ncbi:hypothetical protein NLI96_g1764 [Meripilus lineatus]|uniref:Uncharacterized protein n=1 Tax=Meripilus lineatus TaxID=2056292 RepID=A0AAD5VA08_9APHY|nr:hypothetical protein NLI96_g1764 [Physisporinus lineatus]